MHTRTCIYVCLHMHLCPYSMISPLLICFFLFTNYYYQHIAWTPAPHTSHSPATHANHSQLMINTKTTPPTNDGDDELQDCHHNATMMT